jgi:hypothetical protein
MKRYVTEATTLVLYLVAMGAMRYLMKHPGETSLAANRARKVLAKADMNVSGLHTNE